MSHPTPDDQNFMNRVMTHLQQEYGGVDQAAGTAYLTELGAVVNFGMTGAEVFTEDERFVGTITSDGQITYA